MVRVKANREIQPMTKQSQIHSHTHFPEKKLDLIPKLYIDTTTKKSGIWKSQMYVHNYFFNNMHTTH